MRVNGRKIIIDLYAELHDLSTADKRKVIDLLAGHEDMIEEVAGKLLRFGDEVSGTGWDESTEPDPKSALSRARQELAKISSETARDIINGMAASLRYEHDLSHRLAKWALLCGPNLAETISIDQWRDLRNTPLYLSRILRPSSPTKRLKQYKLKLQERGNQWTRRMA